MTVIQSGLNISPRGAEMCQWNAVLMSELESGVIRFTTDFYVLDKSKAIRIRIAGQTAWKPSGTTSLKTKRRWLLKITNYMVGVNFHSNQSYIFTHSLHSLIL